MHFDVKATGNKSTGDRTPLKLLKSHAIMASGVSTLNLPENPIESCDRINVLQEKEAGNNSNIINEETVAIVNKVLEYECISKKQQKSFAS